jgi:hypothetical protein
MILWSLYMILSSDPGYISQETFELHGVHREVREYRNEPKQLIWAMNQRHYERNGLMGEAASRNNADTNSSSSAESDLEMGQSKKQKGYD